MQELTEREKKLIEYLKILVHVTTIGGIFNDQLIKLFNWRQDVNKSAGLSMEFQDEMLKTLEKEFGIKYTKLDPETHKEIKEDGNKDE
jgi:hypothetical protein